MRRESLLSAAPVRIPPWLPDLRFGKPGRCFEPALGRMALVIGLVAHAVASLSMLGLAVMTLWAWIVSFAIFPCAVVSGLWTASGFIAFALVISVWLVAVFLPLAAPPRSLWRDRSRLLPLPVTAAALACLLGWSL